MTREELIELIESGEASLDGLVHEVFSEAASAINNEGPESQITFLLSSGYSLEDLEKDVREGLDPEKEEEQPEVEDLCPDCEKPIREKEL